MDCIFSGECSKKMIHSLQSCAAHSPLEGIQNYSEKSEINELATAFNDILSYSSSSSSCFLSGSVET